MSVLFLLSNIAVPFLILSYLSSSKSFNIKQQQLPCTKWLLLILYTFFSNWLVLLFLSEHKYFILFDLLVKLLIVFMPNFIQKSLQTIICALHLQQLVILGRLWLLKNVYIAYCFLTQIMGKMMTVQQCKIFRNAIDRCLSKIQGQTPSENQVKVFNNQGSQCEILAMGLLNQQRRQKDILRIQLNHLKSLRQSQQVQVQVERVVEPIQHTHHVQKIVHQSPPHSHTQKSYQAYQQVSYQRTGSMKKKSQIIIQRSSTDLPIQPPAQEQRNKISYSQSPNNHIYIGTHRNSQNYPYNNPQQNKTQQIKVVKKRQDSEQPSMILNKLDVSQYSDMFDSQQQQPQQNNNSDKQRTLLSKVQTIIQIGGPTSARLQIYNIELYSNNDIRIVSLYGRQFQKHKLISMKALKHGYYQMKLEGGKVESRKVKFRGNYEHFMKYLQV